MRSLQILRSTHGQRPRISSACLTHSGTAADFSSESLSLTLLPFLCPLAPRALPRFLATTGTLSSGRGAVLRPLGPERRLLVPTTDPCLPSLNLPAVPSPTTRCRPRLFGTGFSAEAYRTSRLVSLSGTRASWASPLPSRLATSTGRIEFVNLWTSSSSPIALHLASRRRSYLRLSRSGPTPSGDFHPTDSVRSQAH